jgi:threonine dehydratase
MQDYGVTIRDIYQARKNIAHIALQTPLIDSDPISRLVGSSVYLKLENVQQTGSFKLRGAANKIFELSQDEKERGVITVSSGNHGKAVSYVARMLGIPATIVLSEHVPKNKVDAIRDYGSDVVIRGEIYDEAYAYSLELVDKRGLTYIDPFDDPAIIAGQGTIALEILEHKPLVDTIVVPLSGGGLASGVAIAAKSMMPGIQVLGVSMQRGPVMYESIRAGKVVVLEELSSLADALIGGIGHENHYTLEICRDLLDGTVLVSEDEIAAAMAFLLDEHHLVVEGGGAVGVAAVLNQRGSLGEHTAIIISGGSVDTAKLMKIAQKHILDKES